MAILLKNACYIHPDTLAFSNTNILVDAGVDARIHFYDDLSKYQIKQSDEVFDCEGKFVTKSFGIGHHHVYSALARGMPAPEKNPKNFLEVLKYIWWNIDKNLDKESIEASALATAIACAKSGSTFVIDHHASPNFISGSLDIIAQAFEKVGIDHLLCYEITDRDGHEKAFEGLEESKDYLDRKQGLIGLHASFTVDQSTLESAVELMKETDSGIHIRVAEDKADQEHCLKHYNKRVVERLNDSGALDSSKTILVHCLHLDEKEREILNTRPVFIAQNMESNLKNNVGYFNGRGLSERIMLGTDGMHSDMIRSAQAAYFSGQANDLIDFNIAYNRLRKVHQYIRVNDFKGDGDNNLVILDYDTPTVMNPANFLGHFIFGFRASHVQHVISNGNFIVKNRIVQNIDEEEALLFTREQSKRLWSKLLKH